jgi:hypothetical protein
MLLILSLGLYILVILGGMALAWTDEELNLVQRLVLTVYLLTMLIPDPFPFVDETIGTLIVLAVCGSSGRGIAIILTVLFLAMAVLGIAIP